MERLNIPLLSGEPLIAVSPSVARYLDPASAIFLQQLHYFAGLKAQDPQRHADGLIDGRYWVYWNQRDLLQRVPIGLSIDPHKRVIRQLRECGVLLVEQHRKQHCDRTNFFAIDHERLQAVLAAAKSSRPTGGSAADRPTMGASVDQQHTFPPAGGVDADHCTEMSFKRSLKTTPPQVEVVVRDDSPGAANDAGFDALVDTSGAAKTLALTTAAEPYRATLQHCVAELSADDQQRVADEFSDRMERTALGQVTPIGHTVAWLGRLVAAVQGGSFRPSGGLRMALRRQAQHRQQQAPAVTQPGDTRDAQAEAHARAQWQRRLDLAGEAELLAWAERAAAAAWPPRARLAREAVLARQMPVALEAVAVMKGWRDLHGDVPAQP